MGAYDTSSNLLERFFTADQERALLGAVQRVNDIYAKRDHAWIRALLYSGMRLGEFSRLTVGDVTDAFRFGSLFIPREHRKGYSADSKKNRADDHRVRIHDALRHALMDLLDVRAEMGGADGRDASLVLSRKGCGAMTPRAYQQRFKLWATVAGLPENSSPHWLRHTACMRVARTTTAVNSMLAVKLFAGHRSLSTAGVYVQVTKEEMDDALTQAFGGATRRPSLRQRRAKWEVGHGNPSR